MAVQCVGWRGPGVGGEVGTDSTGLLAYQTWAAYLSRRRGSPVWLVPALATYIALSALRPTCEADIQQVLANAVWLVLHVGIMWSEDSQDTHRAHEACANENERKHQEKTDLDSSISRSCSDSNRSSLVGDMSDVSSDLPEMSSSEERREEDMFDVSSDLPDISSGESEEVGKGEEKEATRRRRGKEKEKIIRI